MPPRIDETKCIKCGVCVDVCAEDVYFTSEPGKVPVVSYPEFCFHCNCCVEEWTYEPRRRSRSYHP